MGYSNVTYEVFVKHYFIHQNESYDGQEITDSYTVSKYVVSNFNRYYTHNGGNADDVIFFRHSHKITKIEQTKLLIDADPISLLLEILKISNEIGNRGNFNEVMQDYILNDNRWASNNLNEFETASSHILVTLANLLYQNITYRLLNDTFTTERKSYEEIITRLLSDKNRNSLLHIREMNNRVTYNSILGIVYSIRSYRQVPFHRTSVTFHTV